MPELANDLHFSEKVQNLKPSGIRIFDNKVSKIPGIIKLTLVEPDLNTPEHVKQAAIESIEIMIHIMLLKKEKRSFWKLSVIF